MTPPLLIRESSRVRRARIVVAPHRPVEVVVPPGTSAAWIDGFVAEHREWIERRRAAEPEPSLGLQREGVAWLGGEPQPVPAGDLAGWYRRQARAMLTETVTREAARLELSGWSRIRVGDPRAPWGACSTRGPLLFPWGLGVVLAPRHALVLVAAGDGAGLGRRLRGRPRAVPPPPDEPLGSLLAAGRRGLPVPPCRAGLAQAPRP